MLAEVIKEWRTASRMKVMATENATGVCKSAALLRDMINEQCYEVLFTGNFHGLCIEHIINIVEKECLSMVLYEFGDIRVALKCLPSSIKQRDLFEKVSIELGMKCTKVLDVEADMRQSSTVKIIVSAYKVCKKINAKISRILKWQGCQPQKLTWDRHEKCVKFS